jgi:two-component system probable response regulator PhcQ
MASTSQQAALARRTILFVDDEPLSQKYFKASVGQYANVLTASTPDAALKILTSGGDPISVVVSDERMPHESGVSFLTNVRKSFPSTVRILTSAYADIENLQQAINGAAIYRFVPKPWDFDELCSAMQEALVAERVAETVAAPLEGRLGAGNAESANIELLAVLARELATPLDSLDKEALQLSLLTGTRAVALTPNMPSQIGSWSSQLRLGQIMASAAQVQRDVQHCRSLAGSIAELAAGLCGSDAVQTPSMAETASDALEQISVRRTDRKLITLDARQDFNYRAPKKIMSFVLVNLLQSALGNAPKGVPIEVAVELASGADCNEVRIMTNQNTANPEFSRAVRCALWAFGGELHHTRDRNSGTATTSVRLPRARSA